MIAAVIWFSLILIKEELPFFLSLSKYKIESDLR